jgi:hypothetical protein
MPSYATVSRVCRQCQTPFEGRRYHAEVLGRTIFCSVQCRFASQRKPFDPEAFWSQVDQSDPDGCWPWTGKTDIGGYGVVRRDGRQEKTHRVAFELAYGPLPEGKIVRHFICDNPPCCRPEHLRSGTIADNNADMRIKGRAASGDRNGSRTRPDRQIRGERHPLSKLTEADVRSIRARDTGDQILRRGLAAEYGVGVRTIRKIVERERWRHVD